MRRSASLLAASLVLVLLVASLAVLAACAKTDPVVAAAYSAIPRSWDLSTLEDWRKASVTSLDIPMDSTIRIVVLPPVSDMEASWLALAGRKVWRVEFDQKDSGLLGPILIYVDRTTGKVLGYSPTD